MNQSLPRETAHSPTPAAARTIAQEELDTAAPVSPCVTVVVTAVGASTYVLPLASRSWYATRSELRST